MKGWLSLGAWSVKELAILLAALTPVLACTLALEVRRIEEARRLDLHPFREPGASLALLLAGFEVVLLAYAAVRERGKLGAWFRPGLRPAAWGIAGGLGLILTGAAYERAIGGLGAELPDVAGMLGRLFGPMGMLLVAGVLAPVAEEVYFRGRLLDAARERVGLGWAIALNALAFAAIHGILLAVPAYFVYGAALAWLRQRSGGLVAPVLAHAVNNVAAVAIEFW